VRFSGRGSRGERALRVSRARERTFRPRLHSPSGLQSRISSQEKNRNAGSPLRGLGSAPEDGRVVFFRETSRLYRRGPFTARTRQDPKAKLHKRAGSTWDAAKAEGGQEALHSRRQDGLAGIRNARTASFSRRHPRRQLLLCGLASGFLPPRGEQREPGASPAGATNGSLLLVSVLRKHGWLPLLEPSPPRGPLQLASGVLVVSAVAGPSLELPPATPR
jgi:hypothetical protein